jgi:putative nucleotidyltransferase with HDIG domain
VFDEISFGSVMTTAKTDVAGGFIDRVKNLPPAPTIAAELLGLFSDPDRDIDRIVELIRHDPSLTAEVLKQCNSAVFGRGEPATDVFEAVSRLGFYEVYCQVLALVGSRALAIGRKGPLDAGKLWRHSVTTAVAASEIAIRINDEQHVAFTAGLLHDSGKLIFAASEPDSYRLIIDEVGDSGAALVEKELEYFGVNHAAVGARLMTRWGMPPNVGFAVWYHHESPRAAASAERMAAIISLGNDLAHRVTDGVKQGETEMPAVIVECIDILGLNTDDLNALVDETQNGLIRVEAMLSLAPA